MKSRSKLEYSLLNYTQELEEEFGPKQPVCENNSSFIELPKANFRKMATFTAKSQKLSGKRETKNLLEIGELMRAQTENLEEKKLEDEAKLVFKTKLEPPNFNNVSTTDIFTLCRKDPRTKDEDLVIAYYLVDNVGYFSQRLERILMPNLSK